MKLKDTQTSWDIFRNFLYDWESSFFLQALQNFQKFIFIRVKINVTVFILISNDLHIVPGLYLLNQQTALENICSIFFYSDTSDVPTLYSKHVWSWLWSQYFLANVLAQYVSVLKAIWKLFNGYYFLSRDL